MKKNEKFLSRTQVTWLIRVVYNRPPATTVTVSIEAASVLRRHLSQLNELR